MSEQTVTLKVEATDFFNTIILTIEEAFIEAERLESLGIQAGRYERECLEKLLTRLNDKLYVGKSDSSSED